MISGAELSKAEKGHGYFSHSPFDCHNQKLEVGREEYQLNELFGFGDTDKVGDGLASPRLAQDEPL